MEIYRVFNYRGSIYHDAVIREGTTQACLRFNWSFIKKPPISQRPFFIFLMVPAHDNDRSVIPHPFFFVLLYLVFNLFFIPYNDHGHITRLDVIFYQLTDLLRGHCIDIFYFIG